MDLFVKCKIFEGMNTSSSIERVFKERGDFIYLNIGSGR